MGQLAFVSQKVLLIAQMEIVIPQNMQLMMK